MASRYPKHAKSVQLAEAAIGQHEVPLGSNTGPFVQKCQAASWLAGTGFAWCRCFVLEIHQEAGFLLPDQSAGAWDALARAQARGDALSPQAGRTHAIPGDEVIWAFGSGHSSILKGFTTIGGETYVISIDGNVSDRVEQCQRPLSLVKGFIQWREKIVSVPAVQPPRAQVVGGVSGHRQLVTTKGRVVPLPRKRPGPAGVVPRPAVAAVKKAGSSPAHTGAQAKAPAVKKAKTSPKATPKTTPAKRAAGIPKRTK